MAWRPQTLQSRVDVVEARERARPTTDTPRRLEDIRPWCISRQLWWGHRIPAWFAFRKGAISASRRVEAPSLPQYDSCPSHNDVSRFLGPFGPSRGPNGPKIEKETIHVHHSWRRRASMA